MGARSDTSAVNAERKECCDTGAVGGKHYITSGYRAFATRASWLWHSAEAKGGFEKQGRNQGVKKAQAFTDLSLQREPELAHGLLGQKWGSRLKKWLPL